MESYYSQQMVKTMERLSVLFLTYCYPPQKFPRSVQISHLVQALRKNINLTVITSEPENKGDESLLSFTPLDNVIYAPKSIFSKFVEKSKGYRIKKNILPDLFYFWHFDLLNKTQEYINNKKVDVIATFGQPMSTHIAGLKLKKKYPHLKWVAHFSDPWVDNIFNDYNFWTKCINKHAQNQVFKKADKLIFTSTETIDLVTKNYPNFVRKKSICLPHSFNQNLYQKIAQPKDKKIIIRYIGNFYGNRQPDCLFQALKEFPLKNSKDFKIEFIGNHQHSLYEKIKEHNLESVVFCHPSVNFLESLQLMQTSDLLLLIDAPSENSPFLPSKLIDYIGANKPMFGITPEGTSKNLLEKMGFYIANPNNASEISEKLFKTIEKNKEDPEAHIPTAIRSSFSKEYIAQEMLKILQS